MPYGARCRTPTSSCKAERTCQKAIRSSVPSLTGSTPSIGCWAGAEWVRTQVEGSRPDDPGLAKRLALVGETIDQVREVMIFGESGILACSPPDRRPVWEPSRKRLVWQNGATAQVFSAHDPESLRGPQFDAAWADEFGCAAIDKGGNEPNKFLDPKTSE